MWPPYNGGPSSQTNHLHHKEPTQCYGGRREKVRSLLLNCWYSFSCSLSLCRDKKSRRAEKQKGKKKDEEGSKHVNNNSSNVPTSPTVVEANHQDGDAVPHVPPVCEEVTPEFYPFSKIPFQCQYSLMCSGFSIAS